MLLVFGRLVLTPTNMVVRTNMTLFKEKIKKGERSKGHFDPELYRQIHCDHGLKEEWFKIVG